ncbi:sigma-70 family RNA polymerase sigma factor [Micromonospora profundi]|uniref:sigma-70 family RNA polymerase sigma factor n=1 Tax=Micromonospora profundi TaxID=1420889 RepID=UPI0036650819
MTVENVTRADFPRLTDPFRHELLVHCYRMLGSMHDAEDLVQETYLRAWRSYDGFEGRSSLRTWLYRIATTACLRALENRGRRPLPVGLGAPSADPEEWLSHDGAIPWLEPIPDDLLRGDRTDPAAIVSARQSVRLAFVATLQHLPPRQRAVLVLRDVLQWRAAEVADLLQLSPAAVNSLLQRARATLHSRAPREDQFTEPTAAAERELLDRYVTAFEEKDIAGLVRLFAPDAVWEMPPYSGWYEGPSDIGRHLALRCLSASGPVRLIRTGANGQPALATYMGGQDGDFELVNLQVLTITGPAITRITAFSDPRLFAAFDLPVTAPAGQLDGLSARSTRGRR